MTSTPETSQDPADDAKLAGLLDRINKLAAGQPAPTARKTGPPPGVRKSGPPPGAARAKAAKIKAELQEAAAMEITDDFIPRAPKSLKATGFTEAEIEALVLKFLLARGSASGRAIAEHICLPFITLEDLYLELKQEQLVVYRGAAQMNDYVYQLTDMGVERAKRYVQQCTYFGAAPVTLEEYIESVKAQSLEKQSPTQDDLRRAFSDLLINPRMFNRLGPAINSGKGMFLYGFPGNGKTSIAKRVTKAFGSTIWLPKAIGVDGDIMRLYDPLNHELMPLPATSGLLQEDGIDRRWIRIKRPTIVVGGELTMEHLEITTNHTTGISESPLQMKSNCGTLVIDDFGRQRISTDALLNRWIVPLEERIDFLNLPSGKTIQVPFDQLIVFSTNLEPKDLVDEAFLRRIPYKIEVVDPTEPEFRALFKIMCKQLEMDYRDESITYLVEKHFRKMNRNFRACHPRDLLLQIRNHCAYSRKDVELTPENFDFACENYFAVM